MIPVAKVPEPAQFDQKCRQRGLAWLHKNPMAKRPRDFWSRFKPALADGFRNPCGYSAMYSPVGSVDHFHSWKSAPHKAYEWGNYRFCEEWVNKSTRTADHAVLDPYEVGNGWFEIHLPSLQLKVTDRVPARLRAKAEYTVKRLHLQNDERVLRQRQAWYRLYQEGKLDLDGLQEVAPLIADAVRKAAGATVGPGHRGSSSRKVP